MSGGDTRTMRDAFIEEVRIRMSRDKNIFFLSADMGAPALDGLREEFKERFINVGIAEQNLINISTGLAMEGFTVYAYAIVGFLAMRAYEQIRINLALSSQCRAINVNLIGVGAGVSYDMVGPSHHCFEDLSIIRTLPNIILFSPSDWVTAGKFVKFCAEVKAPKYIRLDGKALPRIYHQDTVFEWERGFCELVEGRKVCLISTGYMTHKATTIAEQFRADKSVGVIDVFLLKPINENALFEAIKKYETVITLEEAFINKGGLDSLVQTVLSSNDSKIKLKRFGFQDNYVFKSGSRDFLAALNKFGENDILRAINEF